MESSPGVLGTETKLLDQSCLSFGPSSALRQRLNTYGMQPLTSLEGEPTSGAIFAQLILFPFLFVSVPY
jgi:hypothetical protein